jgi:YesN/AraC family two-component response regulator
VVEASSAEEAFRLIRNGARPDVLVTDHLMPGMNGTDLARIVRSERPGMRVLLVSGMRRMMASHQTCLGSPNRFEVTNSPTV